MSNLCTATRPIPHRRQRRPAGARTLAERRGASVVEFAIVANLFIAVVFICFEFTRLNMIRNLAQDAAYFAARAAMVPGGTESDAIAESERILAILNVQGGSTAVNGGAAVSDQTRELVVQVTVPISENAFFIAPFTGDRQIEAIATMKTERYDGFFAAN